MERLTARTEHGNAYIPECFSRCEGEGTASQGQQVVFGEMRGNKQAESGVGRV